MLKEVGALRELTQDREMQSASGVQLQFDMHCTGVLML